jgi:lysozyme family protein
MKDNFERCLKLVLVHEGGWSDHPRDPGGATMKGVTLSTFRDFYGAHQTAETLRRITDAQISTIYRAGYWDPCRCNKLPLGVDFAVFDAAVNSGVRRASRWLQDSVLADVDGWIGPQTLSYTQGLDPVGVIERICDTRLAFLQRLATWPTFGRGWGRRVSETRRDAIVMVNEKNQNMPV